MEYIEREAVHRLIRSLDRYAWNDPKRSKYRTTVDIDDVQFGIDKIPAADVAEVRHGKWIKTYPDNRLDGDYYCSNCYAGVDIATGEETPIDRELYYCPNCGARMDGKVCDDK